MNYEQDYGDRCSAVPDRSRAAAGVVPVRHAPAGSDRFGGRHVAGESRTEDPTELS